MFVKKKNSRTLSTYLNRKFPIRSNKKNGKNVAMLVVTTNILISEYIRSVKNLVNKIILTRIIFCWEITASFVVYTIVLCRL